MMKCRNRGMALFYKIFFTVVLIAISFICNTAVVNSASVSSSQEIYENDEFRYRIKDEGICICGLADKNKEINVLNIPSEIEGISVTEISETAFMYNDQISEVYLLDTLTDSKRKIFRV